MSQLGRMNREGTTSHVVRHQAFFGLGADAPVAKQGENARDFPFGLTQPIRLHDMRHAIQESEDEWDERDGWSPWLWT